VNSDNETCTGQPTFFVPTDQVPDFDEDGLVPVVVFGVAGQYFVVLFINYTRSLTLHFPPVFEVSFYDLL